MKKKLISSDNWIVIVCVIISLGLISIVSILSSQASNIRSKSIIKSNIPIKDGVFSTENINKNHNSRSPFVGPTANSLKWCRSIGFSNIYQDYPSMPVIGPDGSIYIKGCDNKLYSFDSTGKRKWCRRISKDLLSTPTISQNGTIYISCYNDGIFAISADNKTIWSTRNVTLTQLHTPNISDKGDIFVNSWGNNLYILSKDGSLQNSFNIFDLSSTGPITLSDNDVIIIAGVKGHLFSVKSNGHLNWVRRISENPLSIPVVDDNNIYLGGYDNLYAIDINGKHKWIYKGIKNSYFSAPAVGESGTLYTSNFKEDDIKFISSIIAINFDGSLKWKLKNVGNCCTTPIVDRNETIYFGSDNGYLYSVDKKGSIKWMFKTKRKIFNSPAIDKDGTLYVTSDKLYALGIE